MPTKDAEDSDGAPRAGTGQLKSWLGGLGKKPKDAETVKVWAQQILMLISCSIQFQQICSSSTRAALHQHTTKLLALCL